MPIKADFHLHSNFSGDSQTPMELMIQRGIELGLDTMCFTEHNDIDFVYEKPEEAGMFDLNTDSYLFDLIKYKEKYMNKIKILFGVEIGVQPHLSKELARYAKSFDFDFIIASAHLCHGKDPFFPSFYEGRSEQDAYREYFTYIEETLRSFNNFDVYGHLDYVVRYGPQKDANYTYAQYQDIIDRILLTILDKEKGIELNTGSLRYGTKDVSPCTDILKRYHELGGEIITIGSDAHSPAYLAKDFDRAAEILTACGFKYYTTFEGRMPSFHKI